MRQKRKRRCIYCNQEYITVTGKHTCSRSQCLLRFKKKNPNPMMIDETKGETDYPSVEALILAKQGTQNFYDSSE